MTAAAGATRLRGGDGGQPRGADLGRVVPRRRRPGAGRRGHRARSAPTSARSPGPCSTGCSPPAASWSPWSPGARPPPAWPTGWSRTGCAGRTPAWRRSCYEGGQPLWPLHRRGGVSASHDDRLDDRLGRWGGRLAARWRPRSGMRTVGDLLRHYPRRYAERGELTDLRLPAGRRAGDGHGGGRAGVSGHAAAQGPRLLEVGRVTDGRGPADADVLPPGVAADRGSSRFGRTSGLFAGEVARSGTRGS